MIIYRFVESAIALMVGCVPAIRGFWRGYVESSRFYTSIGSLHTKLLTARTSKSSQRSNRSHPVNHNQAYDLDKFGVMGSIKRSDADDAYILMESAQGSRNEVNRN